MYSSITKQRTDRIQLPIDASPSLHFYHGSVSALKIGTERLSSSIVAYDTAYRNVNKGPFCLSSHIL